MTIDKRTMRAHRAVWMHHHGPIGLRDLVMHDCDTPSCVEIAHLTLGSSQDNSKDMTQKGRQAKGHKVASSKLSDELITLARRLALTLPQAEVARIVGVSKSQMHRIFHQQNWTHV
jgi:transcriptional regulator GlxA family with amidase domain